MILPNFPLFLISFLDFRLIRKSWTLLSCLIGTSGSIWTQYFSFLVYYHFAFFYQSLSASYICSPFLLLPWDPSPPQYCPTQLTVASVIFPVHKISRSHALLLPSCSFYSSSIMQHFPECSMLIRVFACAVVSSCLKYLFPFCLYRKDIQWSMVQASSPYEASSSQR